VTPYAGWGEPHRQVHGVTTGQHTALCGEPVVEVIGGKSPLPFLAVPPAERCAWCHCTLFFGAIQVAE
jgi:hypothetical protein